MEEQLSNPGEMLAKTTTGISEMTSYEGCGRYRLSEFFEFSNCQLGHKHVIPSGTMVELASVDGTPRWLKRDCAFVETWGEWKKISAAGDGDRFMIGFMDLWKVDSELLKEEELVVGPDSGCWYPGPNSVGFRFVGSPYERVGLPIGMIGMVLKKIRVSPDMLYFKGLTYLNKPIESYPDQVAPRDRNFYIVYCSDCFDLVKAGYYLWHADNTVVFERHKSVGLKNFQIKQIDYY